MQQVMTELVSKRKVDAALGGDRAVVDYAPLAVSIRMRQQHSLELCGQVEALHLGDWGVGENVARILYRDRCDLNGKPVESVRLVKYLHELRQRELSKRRKRLHEDPILRLRRYDD